MLKLAIIIGSTRPGRVGDAVARWVYELARKRGDAEYELVDIKDFDLPMLDEPIPPSQGKYSNEHTKKWAAKIASFDGYVIAPPVEVGEVMVGGDERRAHIFLLLNNRLEQRYNLFQCRCARIGQHGGIFLGILRHGRNIFLFDYNTQRTQPHRNVNVGR